MPTTKTLMTADELLQMPKDGYRYELIEGELKQMSPGGGKHGSAIARFTGRLQVHVEDNNLGEVFGAETGYKVKVNPDDVMAPDISFISRKRLPESEIPDGYLTTVPELVVEVISPSESKNDVKDKVKRWFDFGVGVVVLINPRKRSVTVHHSISQFISLDESSILVLDDVIAGFSYPISKLFLQQK